MRVAGSGDTAIGDVRGRLDVDIAGSGDVTVASIAGPLEVHVAGSGDVKVAGGHATDHGASAIAGSGDVDFRRRRRHPEGPHRRLRRRPRPAGHRRGLQDRHGLRRRHHRELSQGGRRAGGRPKPARPTLDASESNR